MRKFTELVQISALVQLEDLTCTFYGFYSILNLRFKFWSASPNLFSNGS